MLKDKHCFVLGGMDGVPYSQYEFDLEKGDSLFVYTDGLAEANDILGEMFGTDRIVNELNRQEYSDAEALIENMQKSADAFMGEAEQFDDLTMLVVTLT